MFVLFLLTGMRFEKLERKLIEKLIDKQSWVKEMGYGRN